MKRHLPILVLTLMLAANCGGSSSSGGGGGGDTTPPSISSITPASGSSGVARNASLIITFNEALDESVKGTVSLATPSISFSANEISVSGTTVIVNPAADFAASTAHTGIIISGFDDLAGNTMNDHTDAGYTFTTGTESDTTPPTVLSITPADGATGVSPNTNIVITFSEPLSTTKGTVSITTPARSFSAAEISISGSTVTINPATDLAISTAHTGLTVSGFSDAAGNTMSAYANTGYDFTTAAEISTQVAEVTFTETPNTYGSITTSKTVSLSSATPDAVIRYTTDGSTPSRTNGTTYSTALRIDVSATIKAFAYADGLTDSAGTSRAVSISIPLANHVTDWRDESIYFMLTDRFNDGNSLNNRQMSVAYGDGYDYDPDDLGDGKKYQGGDFAGITAKLDYLQNLGITAIWITAPVKQAWNNAGYTSYHGYWAQDFMSVDPHLGTMEDFRVMVYEAHQRGIKVIMDVVVNHAASLFFYDLNDSGAPDGGEWEPAYNTSYAKTKLKWLESWPGNEAAMIAANRRKPMPAEFQNTDWWSFRGGNATSQSASADEILYGDFAGLRDINTTRTDVRAKFKEIFKWWITNTDIDGIRIDTVKHVEGEFWTDFCNELRTWAASAAGGSKKFYMVAEVYDGSASGLGGYTISNKLDTVLGFHMADEVFDWNSGDNMTVFKDLGTWASRPKTKSIELSLSAIASEANLNTNSLHTSGDGLTARQKIGYFIDNHDLNRFLNGTSGTSNETASAGEITNLRMALSWLLTWEGIPVLYYGTEQNYKQSLALSSGGEQGDGAGNCEKGNRPRLWQIKNTNNGNTAFDQTNATFKLIKGLLQLRKTYPELARGEASIKWTDDGVGGTGDDGILAFVRKGSTATTDDDILVVINTHPSQYSAPSAGMDNDLGTDWPVGTTLQTVQIPGFDSSQPTVRKYTTYPATEEVTLVTTIAQVDKTSAVYFQLPPNSIRILKKQ